MMHINRAVWNIAPRISSKWLLRHVRIDAGSQRHPVMLSMASGLSVPIHNDARNRDLRLPAASRVRLPHAQHSLPPAALYARSRPRTGFPRTLPPTSPSGPIFALSKLKRPPQGVGHPEKRQNIRVSSFATTPKPILQPNLVHNPTAHPPADMHGNPESHLKDSALKRPLPPDRLGNRTIAIPCDSNDTREAWMLTKKQAPIRPAYRLMISLRQAGQTSRSER